MRRLVGAGIGLLVLGGAVAVVGLWFAWWPLGLIGGGIGLGLCGRYMIEIGGAK